MSTLFRLVFQYHAPNLSINLDSKRISHRIVFAPHLIPDHLLVLDPKKSPLPLELVALKIEDENNKSDENKEKLDSSVKNETESTEETANESTKFQENQDNYQNISIREDKQIDKQAQFGPFYLLFLACIIYCEKEIQERIVDKMLPEAWNKLLTEQFSNITNIDKLTDIFEDLKKNTPISAIKSLDFAMNKGRKEWESCDKQFVGDIVYPMPTSEVLTMFRRNPPKPYKGIKYIIIDCRSPKSYNFIRLPTAIHIGRKAGFEKKKIQLLIDKFDSAKGAHLTLLGTGKTIAAEDHLIQLICVQFLSRGFKHISYMKEGFQSCIKYISSGEVEFVQDDNIAPFNPVPTGPSTTEQIVNLISDVNVSEKIKGIWNWRSTQNSESNLQQSQNLNDEVKSQIASFALEDSDDESIDIETNVEAQNQKVISQELLIQLDEMKNTFGNEIEIYPCSITTNSSKYFFVLGKNTVMLLKTHPYEINCCIILWYRSLRQILKLKQNNTTNSLQLVLKGNSSEIMEVTSDEEFETNLILFDSDSKAIQRLYENIKGLNRQQL